MTVACSGLKAKVIDQVMVSTTVRVRGRVGKVEQSVTFMVTRSV